MIRYRSLRLPSLLLTAVLYGCIHSPLPGGTQAELFHWDDRDKALSTRDGISSDDFSGFFDGDLDWRDILLELNTRDTDADQPYLMKSCHTDTCYYAVLFPGDFIQEENGWLAGFAALSGISTLMYHEVKSLPAEQVREKLDELAWQVLGEGLGSRDYSAFIGLDAQRLPAHAEALSHEFLEMAAASEVDSGATPSIAQLLNASAVRTSELHAEADFVFSDAWTLEIDVDVSDRISSAAYLMICSDYKLDGDDYVVAYDNCQLKTALVDGRYAGDLRMTSRNSALLVSIMRLDAPQDMEQQIWVRGDQEDLLRLR